MAASVASVPLAIKVIFLEPIFKSPNMFYVPSLLNLLFSNAASAAILKPVSIELIRST